MIKICDLDIGIYQCVSPNLRIREVIITEERIEHIKLHHPNDYERFCAYIPEIILHPAYIIADVRPNTAIVLKQVVERGEYFRLALRLVTPSDHPDYKNSVITFMKIREKEWKRMLRNKKILYKFE